MSLSKERIENHNKQLLKCFKQADINAFLGEQNLSGVTYVLINLDNVLEHVIEHPDE